MTSYLVTAVLLLYCYTCSASNFNQVFKEISDSSFHHKFVRTIFSSYFNDSVDIIHRTLHFHGNKVLSEYSGGFHSGWKDNIKPDAYVILSEDFATFENQLARLMSQEFNPKADFLTIVPHGFNSTYSVMEKLSINLVRKIVIIQEVNDTVMVFTGVYACKALVGIETTDKFIGGKFLYGAKLFRKKLNVQTCPLRVAIDDWPPYVILDKETVKGIEIRVLDGFAERYNFLVEYQKVNPHKSREDKYKKPDGLNYWESILKEVEENRSDCAIGALVMSHSMNNTDVSSPYLSFSGEFLLPDTSFYPKWKSILYGMRPAFLFISVVAMVVSAVLFSQASRDTGESETDGCAKSCLYSLGLAVGQSRPQPKGRSPRPAYLGWSLYSLVVAGMYTTALTAALSRPLRRPQIETLAELLETGYKLYVDRRMDGVTKHVDGEILKRLRIVSSLEEPKDLFRRLVVHKNFSLLVNIHQIIYTTKRQMSFVRVLPERLVTHHVGLVVRKGDDLLDLVNEYYTRALEHGIVEYWKWMVVPRPPPSSSPHPPVRPLTSTDLSLPFYVLVIGLTMSVVALLCEIATVYFTSDRDVIRVKLQRNKKRRK